jgi:hypothetical protein
MVKFMDVLIHKGEMEKPVGIIKQDFCYEEKDYYIAADDKNRWIFPNVIADAYIILLIKIIK